jgi:hypothetical protein
LFFETKITRISYKKEKKKKEFPQIKLILIQILIRFWLGIFIFQISASNRPITDFLHMSREAVLNVRSANIYYEWFIAQYLGRRGIWALDHKTIPTLATLSI